MANPKNEASLKKLRASFDKANALLMTEYRGLTVAQITDLRRKFGEDVEYTVAKNTLVRIVAKEHGIEGLEEFLEGPTAVAFITGEAVDAAKALKEFGKDNQLLVIKGGYMDGNVLHTADVEALAELDNRETTLAKIAGALKAPLTKAAQTFAAHPTKTARLFAALKDKKSDEAA